MKTSRDLLADRIKAVLRLVGPDHITPVAKRQITRAIEEEEEANEDDGLPKHLPMGFTWDGRGPEDDDVAHHFGCWCGDLKCAWNVAFDKARQRTLREVQWDAAVTPGEVWSIGRTAGLLDAVREHGPLGKGERLAWVVLTPQHDENPFEGGVGDGAAILADIEALLDDCDQILDTLQRPNMVKVWAVRRVLARYGGKPHRWPFPQAGD